MQHNKFILIILSSLTILIMGVSCSFNKDKGASTPNIERFENDIQRFNNLNPHEKEEFKNKYADIISIIYNGSNIDSVLPNLPNSLIYKTFYDDVNKKFHNLDTLKLTLGDININLGTIFKEFSSPHIKSYITQYNQSIITTDTTVLIALNQYLGAEHTMYEYYEPYQRVKKVPHQIPFDYAEALIRANIQPLPQNKDKLIDKIIYEGLIAYLTKSVVPSDDNYNLLGYTPEQIKWCEQNEADIWKSFISQDILYSKSKFIATQILSPSPFTAPIAKDSPGELGRWIGLRIITNFVKNNDIDDSALLSSTILNNDSQTILMKAKYNGR